MIRLSRLMRGAEVEVLVHLLLSLEAFCITMDALVFVLVVLKLRSAALASDAHGDIGFRRVVVLRKICDGARTEADDGVRFGLRRKGVQVVGGLGRAIFTGEFGRLHLFSVIRKGTEGIGGQRGRETRAGKSRSFELGKEGRGLSAIREHERCGAILERCRSDDSASLNAMVCNGGRLGVGMRIKGSKRHSVIGRRGPGVRI
ncbi:hypothetical protein C8R46DRAFT_1074655 [Mycena filopes]|nr:hypothetical protein C8R46DRAFT_1074655 [Mycena filopes]